MGVVHREWAGGESAGKGNQAGLVAHKDPRVEERLGMAAHSAFSLQPTIKRRAQKGMLEFSAKGGGSERKGVLENELYL